MTGEMGTQGVFQSYLFSHFGFVFVKTFLLKSFKEDNIKEDIIKEYITTPFLRISYSEVENWQLISQKLTCLDTGEK